MKKPKILHVGGSHSVHVGDLVRELDHLGYPQCVLSYRQESVLSKRTPVYTTPYSKFFPDKSFPAYEKELRTSIANIIRKERPNIIHGHFLIFSCVAINIARELSHLPTYLTPWSARALTTNKILWQRINKCISGSKYFLTASDWVFSLFKKCYKDSLRDNMHVNWRLPLYLSAYHSLVSGYKDTTTPRILSARVMQEANHQDLLVYALPEVFNKYPSATATLIIGQNASQGRPYFNKMVDLAKNLGIYPKCTFINRPLTQAEFADLIKTHNIIYSISDSDTEGSQTTYQAAYSGAITIIKNSTYGYDLIVPNENVLATDLTKEGVLAKLLYAADNLGALCSKFFAANRKLEYASNEHMLPILTRLYDKEAR